MKLTNIVTLQTTWNEAYLKFARQYWIDMAAACDSNVMRMARVSGCHRAHVYQCLKRFGVTLSKTTRHGHRGNWGDLSNEMPLKSTA